MKLVYAGFKGRRLGWKLKICAGKEILIVGTLDRGSFEMISSGRAECRVRVQNCFETDALTIAVDETDVADDSALGKWESLGLRMRNGAP